MSRPGAMTRKDAIAAIEGILAALPASELPKLRIEKRDDEALAWNGGHGYHLGSAIRRFLGAEERRPIHYREAGVYDALVGEAVYRADLRHLKTVERAS